ncbi:MAG: GlsB/YeaQ/YmgE family stress response membrane protein [Bythopirellula sp.]|nr:GlsB/YeaQ/YmgE family stress response membrane protein [Bythopirellula sp.]
MEHFDPTQGVVLNDSLQHLINDVLVWIGFGTVVGLLAKAIMPGRDPGGAIATIFMGIGGTIIGCGITSHFHEGQRIVPISPLGMFVGTIGTLVILFFYKMLGGYYFVEGEYVTQSHRQRRTLGSRRRRRYDSAVYED